jgi:hypothetical protein
VFSAALDTATNFHTEAALGDDAVMIGRFRRRPRPATARAAAAIIATAALALLAAACSSSPSSSGPGDSSNAAGSTNAQSTNSEKALAFARCMRSQGISKYPDPVSANDMSIGLPKVSLQQLGVSSSQFEAANSACAHLLPNGAQSTQAASRQALDKLLNFAGCMRSHEVLNWPDPIPVSAQAPPGAPPYMFDLAGLQGLDGSSFSPQITAAMNECFRLTHLTNARVPWTD